MRGVENKCGDKIIRQMKEAFLQIRIRYGQPRVNSSRYDSDYKLQSVIINDERLKGNPNINMLISLFIYNHYSYYVNLPSTLGQYFHLIDNLLQKLIFCQQLQQSGINLKQLFKISQLNNQMKRQQYEDSPQQQKKQLTITPQTLSHHAQQLTQSIEQNTNLRMKYPDQPQRFYPSEQQLHTILESLTESLSQQHIPHIISSHISNAFIKLLTHPNVDLSLAVVEILYELLEDEPQDDQLFQIYYRWVVWMVDNSCVEAFVGLLVKLDEENDIEEYEAGLKCLKLVQIFINITDRVYEILAEDRQLFEYLANRIMPNFIVKHKIIDDNKYASSDILISLLSNSEKSQHLFSHFSGIQVLLETIASYETKLPTLQDQKQFLNNLFSALSLLLMNFVLPMNKKTYSEMKGNYLMISFIKMRNQHSAMALKCMANSLMGLNRADEQEVVKGIVNDGGLKYLFAVARRKGVRGEDVDEQKAIDENCVTIIYSMVRSLTEVLKDRLQYKLIENRFQNLERLFEMRVEYLQAAESIEEQDQVKQQQKEKAASQARRNNQYISKLSEGLSLVQTIDKTILVLVEKYPKLKAKISNLLKIYSINYEQIQSILKDHYEYMGMKEQKAYVEVLIANNLRLMKKIFEKMDMQKVTVE